MRDSVLVELRGHALVITINRPEARNAVNLEVARTVGGALERAERDAAVWAVIITGSGDRAFCAGADLKAIMRGEPLIDPETEHWKFAGWTNHFISKPTIAAVNGLALGGGTEIVLSSDLAIASKSATFGLPEVKRGLVAAGGGAFRLPQQVPWKRGMELLFTGDAIDAMTAEHLGLVNMVVPDGEVVDAALALASQICRNSPAAVQATKRIAYGHSGSPREDDSDAWQLTAAESSHVRSSADGMEGPRAFAEKRQPVWTGG